MDKTLEILERVIAEAKKEEKQATGVMSAQRLHGIGGLFSTAGLDQNVFSTYVRPQSIMTTLQMYATVDEDPRYGALTGFTAPDGSQPTNACQDAPSGFTKSCTLTAMFGLHRFDTQEIEMDQVMLRANRGDFKDLRLMGDLLTELAPEGLNQSNVLNVVTAMEMLRTGAYMENQLAIDCWQGTVAGGSFPGLMYQVATGQVDAATNTACPSLDSDVKDFTYNDVCGTGKDIVEYLSSMMYYLESLAATTGLAPVKWVLAMRPQLWFELSACWPCSYMTNRCLTANIGESVVRVDGSEQVTMRDELRRSMTLPVNGIFYDVVVDTGIYETTEEFGAGNLASGEYSSSIFAIPLTIQGAFPVTYREYLDYRQAAPDVAMLRGQQRWFNTDSGAYSWAYHDLRWCYILSLKTEQRVVLRTPQLAGVLQNVMYSPLQHLREPAFDSPYHSDGGISLPSTSTRYAVWASSGTAGR